MHNVTWKPDRFERSVSAEDQTPLSRAFTPGAQTRVYEPILSPLIAPRRTTSESGNKRRCPLIGLVNKEGIGRGR